MNFTNTARRLLVLVAGCALGGALVAAPAQSALDTTPPTLTTPVKASFHVGQQMGPDDPDPCGDGFPHDVRLWVPMTFAWQGSDASGSVRYDLVAEDGAGPYEVFYDSAQTSYRTGYYGGTNYDNDCGGPSPVTTWQLTATDSAGNKTSKKIYGGGIRLTQDSNLTDLAGYAIQPTITYQGSWSTASCKCWSDGGVHKTTAKGASVTIKANSGSNYHVGLVMEKGPTRGKFQIYVDGALRKTVDLYASASKPRTIVWQTAFLSGSHSIELVNLATPGRTRIDLDAVLTN